MSWFADLAGKAENLLTNLDEQTGAALRNHSVTKKKNDHSGTDFRNFNSEVPLVPKRRSPTRGPKKAMPIPDTKSVYSPSRKSSPTSHSHHQARLQTKDNQDSSRNGSVKSKRSPSRKSSPHRHQYDLNHCPKTLVGDVKDSEIMAEHFGLKQRRLSLPSDLELLGSEDWMYKIQNLEVENAMLKNELNVMNHEIAELLDRLRKTEDGNDVDSPEAAKVRLKLETVEVSNQHLNSEKQSLTSQVELLKIMVHDYTNAEIAKYKEKNESLNFELTTLIKKNNELEEKFKDLSDKEREKETAQIRLENDLRHAQSTISDLQGNLEKTTEECRRLEKDWESYKLRVKNMLVAKDSEIKSLQEGLLVNEDTKILLEQIELLKEERDDMSEAVALVRSECSDMKAYLHQVEERHSAAELVVAALRDALREERTARNKAEAQSLTVAKELKAMQMETGQTIANLRSALRDKENELHHLRDTSSTVRTADTSALNVADYDDMQSTIDNNKVHYLTQTLVQRQTKIDHLLAENNMLRIQLEKLESKFKSEVSSLRANHTHSVVHLQEGDCRTRTRIHPINTLSALSLRLGVMVKRYPVIRIFVIAYMVFLHFWVLTVLFTSKPEDTAPQSKS